MDLSTTWLGLDLPHPLMPGASPLVDDLDMVRRLEDAGAAAIVMHSLFEEQITGELMGSVRHMEAHGESFPEALTYFPEPDQFALGPDEYLEQIHRIKEACSRPVIASLNGSTPGGWLRYARLMEEAGADALEINLYALATDPEVAAAEIEAQSLEVIRRVCEAIWIPVAVKLSPYYTAFAQFARRVANAGAEGLVLFNRFYQPDLDLEALDVKRTLHLSDSSELLLRLRWMAVLWGKIEAGMAVSGGVHTGLDALKAVMAGAHAVQMVSALLREGPEALERARSEMVHWLEEHEYDSLEQARGSLSLQSCPDPAAYERANYMSILQTWEAD